jgi:energy-coupling factor transport system ATP-binding protein
MKALTKCSGDRNLVERKKVIEVKDLHFAYPDGTVALKGVNLDIYENEIVGIIGQNGSGKTTLVKHFNGILKPTSGKVIIEGVDTTKSDFKHLAKRVGYVYQNPSYQLFCNSVEKEVAFGPTILGFSKDEIEKRVNDALERMGLEKKRKEYPFFLSMGERQRLAIASVLAINPSIIIVDEPTTGQDIRRAEEIMNLLMELHKEGRTIIVITHDMRIIADYVPRTVVMFDGKILAEGPTRQIFADPKTLFKAFVLPPQITRLAQKLGNCGFPPDLLTAAEMYDCCLCFCSGSPAYSPDFAGCNHYCIHAHGHHNHCQIHRKGK